MVAKGSLKKGGTGDAKQGKLEIIRPSKLAESGVTGPIVTGTYEGAKPNKFDASKKDYFIRAADDTLYILNETQSLKEQLAQLEGTTDVNITVNYNGKVKTKNGKGFHDFEVFVN